MSEAEKGAIVDDTAKEENNAEEEKAPAVEGKAAVVGEMEAKQATGDEIEGKEAAVGGSANKPDVVEAKPTVQEVRDGVDAEPEMVEAKEATIEEQIDQKQPAVVEEVIPVEELSRQRSEGSEEKETIKEDAGAEVS